MGDLIRKRSATERLIIAKTLLESILQDMPTAEPIGELIRCRDCKFTDEDGPIDDGRYWCVLHESFMYFCSDAERRSDG